MRIQPPYKPKTNIGRYIVYKVSDVCNEYKVIDIKDKKCVGEMSTYRDLVGGIFDTFGFDKPFYSLYIENLKVFERFKGIGTMFINIAKKESVREGCSGNLHLYATDNFDFENPSYIFYRKMGFQMFENDIKIQNHIDECIINHKKTDKKIATGCIPMFIKNE